MGSNWPQYTLVELAQPSPHAMSTGPFGSAISSKYFQITGVPVIRGGNLSTDIGCRLSDENLVYVSAEKASEFRRSLVRDGDLIFTCWGTINQIGLITKNQKHSEYIISNKQMKFTPDQSRVDSLFLYYLFSSPIKQTEILQNGIGAAVPGFNLGQLKQHKVTLPPLREQVAISDLLGSLDNKITLNHQINTTLESMAQALFKSWFVDFDPVIDNALAAGNPIPEELKTRAETRAALGDQRKPLPDHIRQQFPDRFVLTEEMGWVPEGWKITPLSRIAALKTQSIHPGKEPEKVWAHFSIPAFDDGMNPSYDRGETIKSGKYEVPKTAILASKLNPQFPRIWMPDVADESTSVCSTEFMPFVPKNPAERPYIYSLFCSDIMQSEISNRVTGSTGSRQRVKPKEIAELPILMPLQSLRMAFCDIACSFFEKKSVVQCENLALQKLRDTLLPKLLSGELRLPEAEKHLAEAL